MRTDALDILAELEVRFRHSSNNTSSLKNYPQQPTPAAISCNIRRRMDGLSMIYCADAGASGTSKLCLT
jgi:hypothetical protein